MAVRVAEYEPAISPAGKLLVVTPKLADARIATKTPLDGAELPRAAEPADPPRPGAAATTAA